MRVRYGRILTGVTDFLPRMRFYNPHGKIGDVEFRVEDIDQRRIALTEDLVFNDRPARVSTILVPNAIVFLGAEGDKPFETQIFYADTAEPVMTWRYPTREVAELSHQALVKVLGDETNRGVLEQLVQMAEENEREILDAS